jgi:hypothetical protein
MATASYQAKSESMDAVAVQSPHTPWASEMLSCSSFCAASSSWRAEARMSWRRPERPGRCGWSSSILIAHRWPRDVSTESHAFSAQALASWSPLRPERWSSSSPGSPGTPPSMERGGAAAPRVAMSPAAAMRDAATVRSREASASATSARGTQASQAGTSATRSGIPRLPSTSAIGPWARAQRPAASSTRCRTSTFHGSCAISLSPSLARSRRRAGFCFWKISPQLAAWRALKYPGWRSGPHARNGLSTLVPR